MGLFFMGKENDIPQIIKAAIDEIWLKNALAADNPADYLNHESTAETGPHRYYPRTIQREGKTWVMSTIIIQSEGNNFTYPLNNIYGVFVKPGRIILSMKNPTFYLDETEDGKQLTEEEQLPYNPFYITGESNFIICYTEKRGNGNMFFDKNVHRKSIPIR